MTPHDDTSPNGSPQLTWSGPAGTRHAQPHRDDTTRYLCAAAHMDPDFANSAIREFLIEDTRSVPTTPGVDTAAVLREAVAARTRSKLRDLGLVLLLIAFVFLTPAELLVGWIVLAIVAAVPAAVVTLRQRSPSTKVNLVVGLVVVALLLYLGLQLLSELTGDPYPFDSPSYYYDIEPDTAATTAGAIGTVTLMFLVLIADRFVVWRHLNERFWPNRPTRPPAGPQDRPVFQFSSNRQLTQLTRYTNPVTNMVKPDGEQAGEPVRLVVYRDFKPFVGAGMPDDPWSIAVPLEELPDAKPTTELTTESLYAGIHEEITSLRAATALAPGRRLGELHLGELVIVSADELIDHLAEPSAADFLQRPGVAPYTMIRRKRADSIRSDPLEWARYYQCYQVETWDRDLVVTVFVHVAVDQGALYVEWTPCVLRPIKRKYRKIDEMSRSPLRPAGRALLDLLSLPVSLPGRLVRLLWFLRPMPRDRGIISADMYGSSASLRELAADHTVHNYFQLADVDRYLKMMESRLILAVSRKMRAAGFSPASFDAQAAAVVNNNVQIAGSVGGDVVVGSGNRVGDTTPRETRGGKE